MKKAKKQVRKKVKRVKSKKTVLPIDTTNKRLAKLEKTSDVFRDKINELVTKTNLSIDKICTVLDAHEKKHTEILQAFTVMQDSLKTLSSTVSKLSGRSV